ncbi:MAG TPA: DUF4331 domain-containing protein, partial [Bryobacteraceae bacterium]|nr:DUF4331 domain-containing protein [Bryobacteraceae bacterium]
WYAFVSPEHPDRVIMILNVDPFLEPSNGPNYFPFDPAIRYRMHVDNDRDGVEDVTFEIRFHTQVTNSSVFTGYVGGLAGIPPITSFTGPGAQGLNLIQTYDVTMVTKNNRQVLNLGQTLFAVPSNVGPRTMPNYAALRAQGIYSLANGVRVFAGTVADPFFIDLGATFDSLNFRMAAGGGVLTAAADADDTHNYAPNALAGFNVNSIVLEVPITMLTADGNIHPAGDKMAVLGTYGATYRRKQSVLRGNGNGEGGWAQVQRMGNPLINEAIIGTGSKDRFSTDEPKNDAQFANFFLNPLLGQIFASIGIPVPPAPRTDLLPLVQYMAPICPGCGPKDQGPIADLLRLNTGIPPTSVGLQKRLGFLAGDTSGFPNGRRPIDDVFDIAGRAVGGALADAKYNTRIGDGVNTGSSPLPQTFPFEAAAYSGRDSAHAGPGQPGCINGPGGNCPVN